MKHDTSQPPEASTNRRTLEDQLWTALGRRHQYLASLVPGLAEDVTWFRKHEASTTQERADMRERFDRQRVAAERITMASRALCRVLMKSRHLIGADEPITLADLMGVRDLGIVGPTCAAIEVVGTLADEADRWKELLKIKISRKADPRVRLAEWVGLKLAIAGIPISTTKSNPWARVVGVMNYAAGLPVEPYQERDLTAAIEYLRRAVPTLVPPRLQKTRQKK